MISGDDIGLLSRVVCFYCCVLYCFLYGCVCVFRFVDMILFEFVYGVILKRFFFEGSVDNVVLCDVFVVEYVIIYGYGIVFVFLFFGVNFLVVDVLK